MDTLLAMPAVRPDLAASRGHYDELDPFYRAIWGEHLHHGLWEKGTETVTEAVEGLVRHVAAAARLRPGQDVCDIGCGYGATARLLAREFRSRVVGVTPSARQYAYAIVQERGVGLVTYRCRDWLDNGLHPGTFDAALAIESSEHVADKAAFFDEVHRVLRPGGRVVVCAWLAPEDARPWARRWLLDPICREGSMAGLGSRRDYQDWMRAAGLEPAAFEDLTPAVRRTWPICCWRFVREFVRSARLRAFVLRSGSPHVAFARAVFRIWAAYALGCMTYALLVARNTGCGPTVEGRN